MPAANEAPDGRRVEPAALTLFALLWGAVALFHNLGPSGRVFGLAAGPNPVNVTQAVLTACALWLIAEPRSHPALASVAVMGPVTAWFEAPQLGNHWLLASFVDVGILVAMLASRRGRGIDREVLAAAVLPTARWCLVIFYCFAAFAKLNPAFFDTSVSCSTFFFDETASSYGLPTPLAVGGEGLWRLVPAGAAATELAVPLLLIFRRTRVAGVVLGLLFHSAIALDRYHLFVDFSALLAALFLLFMPPRFAKDAVSFLDGRGRPWLLFLFTAAAVAAALQLTGAVDPFLGFLYIQGRMIAWYLFDATVLAGVLTWLWRHRGEPQSERPFALVSAGGARPVLAGLLVVVFANGLLPYLELRTAFAYTMYSNIRLVDGDSNHFLIRASLPVGGRQEGLVRIDASSDLGLRRYIDTPYRLPWDSFRTYLSRRPEVAVHYTREGRRSFLSRAADDPELVDAPPLIVQKGFPMRAVDIRNPPSCQDVFLPAL